MFYLLNVGHDSTKSSVSIWILIQFMCLSFWHHSLVVKENLGEGCGCVCSSFILWTFEADWRLPSAVIAQHAFVHSKWLSYTQLDFSFIVASQQHCWGPLKLNLLPCGVPSSWTLNDVYMKAHPIQLFHFNSVWHLISCHSCPMLIFVCFLLH